MAITPFSLLLFLFVTLTGTVTTTVSATVFTLLNQCSYTIWPGSLSAAGSSLLGDGGFILPPSASIQFSVSPGWSGRFWSRTGCTFDETGAGTCTTGECGGLKCNGAGGSPPVSLAEFTIAGSGGMDFYDVSLVDGYNVGVGIRPSGGTGLCQYAGCVSDLNERCPPELRVMDPAGGEVVACKSACAAFNTAEYCCTGDFSTPETCSPTDYSKVFKSACPTAYSYAYDDGSSTCTCTASDYLIIFCPSNA